MRKVRKAIKDVVGLDVSGMVSTTRLEEGIGMDSLDLVELAIVLEDEFYIEIGSEMQASWETIGDVERCVESLVVECPSEAL